MDNVLGFRKKDAIKDKHTKINPFGLWHMEPKKLVPVVSVKWLKKWRISYIKENQFIDGGLVSEVLDDLLSAVKKETGK